MCTQDVASFLRCHLIQAGIFVYGQKNYDYTILYMRLMCIVKCDDYY